MYLKDYQYINACFKKLNGKLFKIKNYSIFA